MTNLKPGDESNASLDVYVRGCEIFAHPHSEAAWASTIQFG